MASEPEVRANSNPIYHYTDTGGLIGIISTSTIRATGSQFLNDSLELEYGMNLLKNAILDEVSVPFEPIPDEAEGVTVDYVQASMRSLSDMITPSSVGDTYVASFSLEGDSLSQWRAYANLGFAIEFDGNEILNPPAKTSTPNRFYGLATTYTVSYGSEALAEATRLARQIKRDLRQNPSIGQDGVHLSEYLTSSNLSLGTTMPFLKHESFADEREFRLCLNYGTRPSGFKSSPLLGPVPYAEWKFDSSAIRRVLVAPGANQEVRALAVERLLAENVPSMTEVSLSKSSYRG
ncbi:DUF2971 domain-containing protein [Dietzia maris]|uniref:DUF2971 domain-containing protein n=1 Tax=Dietzia maris TaxID=37915 RepID=UPI00223A7EDB|nr:DUF2971 domain-containing protein [Dietzia maris]MCT1433264.1 DUF2971 domain-containing protein [Dietzia maris]MCT1520499.1 DUF2971 domain-containing protein [Dietzia maris]